ncbi:MAG: VCBS repeat-containing protein, partial [Planctomycetota bacterium]|nr:VCBS repeat-containing protein [Planctomycetota bacterium]
MQASPWGCVFAVAHAASAGSLPPDLLSPDRCYPVGFSPVRIVAADFNGDGAPDLAATNQSGYFSILLNRGNGVFDPEVRYNAGLAPGPIAVADFNGDQILDLAVCNRTDDDVSIHLGDGAGAFTLHGRFPVFEFPNGLAAADLNEDGVIDLAATCSVNGALDRISILIGIGNGSFAPATHIVATDGPTDIAAADLNGDQHIDLIATCAADDEVAVLLGNGDGTFGPELRFDTGSAPRAVAIADLNNDQGLDLIVANQGPLNAPTSDVSPLF